MKKIFTLLALCLSALTSFAQDAITSLTEGGQYYIAVGKGNNTNGIYVTAAENGEILSMKKPTNDLVTRQTWTAHKVSDAEDAWTFSLNIDGETWYMYTNGDDSRVYAGTEETAGENFKNYIVNFNTDDPTAAYASVQMLETADDPTKVYMNSFGGQKVGANIGPWTDGSTDDGSKVYFTDPGNVDIPTWDFSFNNYKAGDNSTRYFIEFARSASASIGGQKGPLGINGLTLDKLVLTAIGDTLCADSVTEGSDMYGKIWHVVSYDVDSHVIQLVNEKGQYIKYVDTFDTPLASGNDLFVKNEDGTWKIGEDGEYVRTGKSGGGTMNGGFMLTSEASEAAELYCQASQYGSECYAIGTAVDGENFINAWGNVSWHCFMGKWTVDDQNCALKFMPIDEVLSESQIPEDPTHTGISTITPAKKTTTDGTVYTIDGRVAGKSLNGLAKGLYIVGGKKVIK